MLSRQILLEDIAAVLKDAPPIIIPLQTHCEDEDELWKKGHLVGNDGAKLLSSDERCARLAHLADI